jgi:hypothetical protein
VSLIVVHCNLALKKSCLCFFFIFFFLLILSTHIQKQISHYSSCQFVALEEICDLRKPNAVLSFVSGFPNTKKLSLLPSSKWECIFETDFFSDQSISQLWRKLLVHSSWKLACQWLIISKALWRSFLVDSWSSLMADNSQAFNHCICTQTFKCDSTVMKKLWVLILINLTCW